MLSLPRALNSPALKLLMPLPLLAVLQLEHMLRWLHPGKYRIFLDDLWIPSLGRGNVFLTAATIAAS